MSGRTALLLCHAFPPSGDAGATRPFVFARGLVARGWRVQVVCAEVGGAAPAGCGEVSRVGDPGETPQVLKRWLGLDPERRFREHAGASAEVGGRGWVEVAAQVAKGAVVVPDAHAPWAWRAYGAAAALLAEGGVDVVLSSSPPHSVHLAAARLARRFGVPWVADLRDLWTQDPYYDLGPVRRVLDRPLERWVLGGARAALVASPDWVEPLRRRYGGLIAPVLTGFDGGEPVAEARTDRLRITYAGSLYGGGCDLRPVLEGVVRVLEAGVLPPERVEVCVYGRSEPVVEGWCGDPRLRGCARHGGRIAREELRVRLAESQLNVVLGYRKGERRVGAVDPATIVPAKLFDYLGARRPILADVEPGSTVARLLERTGAGVHASAPEEVARCVVAAAAEFAREGTLRFRGDAGALAGLTREAAVGRVEEVLEGVVR